MSPDSEALRQIRATAQILEGLREQDATWAGPPAGSSMAADDEVWALIGGCLALWVVGCDDDAVRRARALALVAEDYKYRHAFHQSQLHSEDPARAQHSVPWVQHWEGRQLDLAAVRAGLPKASAKVTSIVTWVAREMFGSGADSYATLLGLWQSSSSSAHGLGWGAFVRPGLNIVGHDPIRGLSGFHVVLDVDDAADRYLTCVALLVLADGLFRERCSS